MNVIILVIATLGGPCFSPVEKPAFVREMHQGFVASYRGQYAKYYPRAEELGWGQTTVVTDDVNCPQKEAYWYAYRDGSGILKLVFQQRLRFDFAVELGLPDRLVWTSQEIFAVTREGKRVWTSSDEGFTIMNANFPAVILESMLGKLFRYAVIVNRKVNPF